MSELLAIAVGGALGALARFWSTNFITGLLGAGFPYGILIVNVIGSLLIGIAFVVLVERTEAHGAVRSFVMVGLLGAFTTFSTFSLQTLGLIEAGRLIAALAYVFGSVLLCMAGVTLGVYIARMLN
ncbi:MAG: fluoride efflux transporter CrcB [Proteobacteria bacterium]|jgi:CrcB protein|nr:fluoride efflux transporter CrcB [Pseudomonadota bacterium]MDA1302353.1 fluoride efflux transporter CrcB [Pseudomonadota bacterium]